MKAPLFCLNFFSGIISSMATFKVKDDQVKVPTFGRIDGNGSEFALLGIKQYIELLIQANETDEELWPPDYRQGAKYLARIREIERDCREKHGKWDWELIEPELQDEYDDTCALLDQMRYDEEKIISWDEMNRIIGE